MKLKTRLVIAFMTIIILPVLLTSAVFCGFAQLQIRSIEKTYGITGTTYEALLNSVQVPSRLRKRHIMSWRGQRIRIRRSWKMLLIWSSLTRGFGRKDPIFL